MLRANFMKGFHRIVLPVSLCVVLCLASTFHARAAGNGPSHDPQPSQALRIAAVQLQIRQSDLDSFAVFRSRIDTLIRRCMDYDPDLIVFPEYTSVFLALVPYHGLIRDSRSAEEGLARIRERDPLIAGFRDLFLVNSGLVERAMEEIFAASARRYGVAIIAGTYFAWSGAERTALVNRLVLYDPSGQVAYTQDKVYLTPFEEQLLGISAGSLDRAKPIVLQGYEVGITICRDTFFSAWLQVHSGVDLWIDIKANGTVFTQEERQRFLRAVPARISEGGIPYGLTVCLTGSLLDLLWEGQSSLARLDPAEGARYVQTADSATDEEILFLSIDTRGE
jgi:predicted amidohydrolase